MAASPPKSVAAVAVGTEEEIQDESTHKSPAEDLPIGDETSKQHHADQGTKAFSLVHS